MKNNILELKPFIRMGAEKLREELYLLIAKTDEKYLKAIHTLLVKNIEEENQVVGYRPDGSVITKMELMSEVEEGINQIESGNYTTTKELREKLSNK